MKSLRDKAISGFFWSFLQKVGSRAIMFLVTIILARLLTPVEFGLVGMLTIFIQLSQVITTAGFNQALIQKQGVTKEDFSSVFFINLGISIFLYVLIFISAPFIAAFFQQPLLTPLAKVLSLVFIINAFSYVQEARMVKMLHFKSLAIIEIPAIVIAGTFSIVFAIYGLGVWSLVLLQIIYRLVFTLHIWLYSRWIPSWAFNGAKAKRLFAFGGNLMLSQVINTIFKNSYLVIIGKFFPLSSVGYYQNASNLVLFPTSTITTALKKVSFSVFSRVQDDNKQMREGYKRLILQTFFWLCPGFAFAAALAPPLFSVLFTDKWLPAVPYFRILCIVGMLWPISDYNLNVINVKGRSDLTLKLELFKKFIITISILIAIQFGILAVVLAQAFNAVISYSLNSFYSGKFIQYPFSRQITDILPTFLLSISIGTLIFLADQYVLYSLPNLIRLLVGLGGGAVLYGIIARERKFQAYTEFIEIMRSLPAFTRRKKEIL